MEDPKVKPKICISENCNNHVAKGRYCPACTYKQLVSKKKSKFNKWKQRPKSSLDKAISKADRGIETAEKLFKKGLVLWSLVVRGEEDHCFCKTCGKALKTKGGIHGAHAGHYLDKANHWKLALDPDNGIIQCKECNVDYIHSPSKIEVSKIKMRQAMIQEKGKDVTDSIDQRGEEFRIKVKRGEENSKPRTNDPMSAVYGRQTDVDFLKSQIQTLKLMLKQ